MTRVDAPVPMKQYKAEREVRYATINTKSFFLEASSRYGRYADLENLCTVVGEGCGVRKSTIEVP